MTSVTDSRLDVDLVITDPAWSALPLDLTALSTAAVRAAMATTAHDGGEVVVALGDDAWIRDLNARHRDRDTPTNVLAFPADAHGRGLGLLGDLALARETIIAEAAAADKALADHLTHLIVHGCLHLLGHDHIQADEAARMEALEVRVLADLGIDDPYQDQEADQAAPAVDLTTTDE